ncbi:N-acetylmuramoyl-L-alanine amidase [Palleronia sediminis]|uniref:N-acetylmuramoyl-L-alanine amidase n=2 Tax=Palleronia sediminis TaxID=2547833 RepID=A0A4V6PPB3_9RHOB|nr:N-acetylmuramoyl-L-alanine amidase [Palleronia sediminis]
MAALASFWLGQAAAAQSGAQDAERMTALARIDVAASRIEDFGSNLLVDLALSQPVPWRVFTLDEPRRLVIDFGEVDFAGTTLTEIVAADMVSGVTTGRFREGWSRLVLALAGPMAVETAGLSTGGPGGIARMKLQLAPVTAEAFARDAGPPDSVLFGAGDDAEAEGAAAPIEPMRRQSGERPLRVTIDPGHGGIDPGAEAEGVNEADIVLAIAKQLAAALKRLGMEATLTRTDDVFVPLERRMSIAREARSDVFLSLHADALDEGQASGATVYTLSTDGADEASQKLVERHEPDDLLTGLDLMAAGDEVALVLMEMARAETLPRSERLADEIVAGLARETGDLHKRPRLRADFSVLKAADIPSVLIELGFLSSAADRARLADPMWRQAAVNGIRAGIENWSRYDAIQGRQLRQ